MRSIWEQVIVLFSKSQTKLIIQYKQHTENRVVVVVMNVYPLLL